jgi:hypothetical protein
MCALRSLQLLQRVTQGCGRGGSTQTEPHGVLSGVAAVVDAWLTRGHARAEE